MFPVKNGAAFGTTRPLLERQIDYLAPFVKQRLPGLASPQSFH